MGFKLLVRPQAIRRKVSFMSKTKITPGEHSTEEITQIIQALGQEFEAYTIKQRHHFHKYPELGLKEFRTTSDIVGQLDAMGVELERPLETGCVATIRGTAPDAYDEQGNPRRRILLRADIDALPVHEKTDEVYASVNEGCMHACGHDTHIAMMLGAIQILRHMTDDIHGEVRIVFQPAEEISTGARLMVDKGVCEGVDGCYAAHIWSEVDAGKISCEAGPRMANTDWFRIDVLGTSCHGAMPHRGADANVVAAELVNALQVIVSRKVSPYDPVVVTIGEIHGGTARNVVSGSAYLTGTVRTYNEDVHHRLPEIMSDIVEGVANALGAEAHVTQYETGSWMVENQAEASERCKKACSKVLGPDAVGSYKGTLSGEDYSEYLHQVPGIMVFIGARNEDLGAVYAQHSCYYTIDESVLIKGSMLAAQYAIDFLSE